MEECQKMQVDSFIRSLPPYMRASPFMHFEQTYDEYETCSEEQMQMLRKRMEDRKAKAKSRVEMLVEDPLDEWTPSVDGVAIQTSDMSLSLPPCTCRGPIPTPVSSVGRIYRYEDLIPLKQALDEINKECLFDSRIEFDRFQLIGHGSDASFDESKKDFNKARLDEIKKILKKHPSLCDLFQANTQC